jgi:hypothetical protein
MVDIYEPRWVYILFGVVISLLIYCVIRLLHINHK